MLGRIKNLSHCQIMAYCVSEQMPDRTWIQHTTIAGDASYDDCTIIKIGDRDKDRDYYLCPDLLSAGDYGETGIVGMANFRAFYNKFEEHCHKLFGWFNSFGVAISINWLLRESDEAEEIMETLEALEDYPLISDEVLTEIESELAEDAWLCWVKDDYTKGLENRFDINIKKDLREVFQAVLGRESIYWEPSGNDVTIDLAKVIEKTELEELT